jgi:hypothetical protein
MIQAPITDIQAYSGGGQDWIITGDASGYFTCFKIDPNNQIGCTLGAFNDTRTEHHQKILLMFMSDPTTLYALSVGGIVRQWTL